MNIVACGITLSAKIPANEVGDNEYFRLLLQKSLINNDDKALQELRSLFGTATGRDFVCMDIADIVKSHDEVFEIELCKWRLKNKFTCDPLSGYDPISVDIWFLQQSGLLLDNLFYRQITLAETKHIRVEIDYTEDFHDPKFKEIRIFEKVPIDNKS